jgi:hypothetical protein
MALMVSGLLNKQAAAELGVIEITVKSHRGQVLQKMKANSLADLVRMAANLRPARQADSLGLILPDYLQRSRFCNGKSLWEIDLRYSEERIPRQILKDRRRPTPL